MQPWRFSRMILGLLAILVLTVSLTVLGCGGGGSDDDGNDFDDNGPQDAEASELANLSFSFDASLLDPRLAGLQAMLEFGQANGDRLPFALTIDGTNALSGTAVVASVEFFIARILVNGVDQSAVTLNGVTFIVNPNAPAFELDITLEADGDNLIIRIRNPLTGATVTFTFQPGQTGSTGTTGTGGAS